MVHEDMKLLGHKVIDRVTGFAGVVTSISFDLYGCVQAIVTPPSTAKDPAPDSRWFDAKRLDVKSKAPVMAVPTFATGTIIGPESKPTFAKLPTR